MSVSPRAYSVLNTLLSLSHSTHRNVLIILIALVAVTPVKAQEPDWNQGGTLHITQSIDSSSTITLNKNLTLNIDAGHIVRLRGKLSNPQGLRNDGLIKKGAGRLELSGDNSDLDTFIALQEGTLHVSGHHALGKSWSTLEVYGGTTLSYEHGAEVANPLSLGNDLSAIEWRVDSGIASHLSGIIGTTPLIKRGSGTLRLTGVVLDPNSHMTINEGSVHLVNQFSGRIDIENAATLSGNGRSGKLFIHPGGVLAPTGQMTVNRELHFRPDSRFHVRISPQGEHDSVGVLQGPAKLNGHVLALPLGKPQDWQRSVDAVIVQTRDGIGESRFTSVASALPYLDAELHYDSHRAILQLRPRRGGLPSLQRDQTGSQVASLRSMMPDDSRFIREAVYTHGITHSGFWSHAFHSSGDYRAHNQQNGYDRRINGLFLGSNRTISGTWRLGIYGGASTTHVHQHFATSERATTSGLTPRFNASVNSVHLGMFTHTRTDRGTQLTAGTAHSRHSIRSSRNVITPVLNDALSSRYRALSTQVFAKAQHPLWASTPGQHPQTSIDAFTSLAWVHTRQSGHTERGGPLALHLPTERTHVLFNSIGLSASHHLQGPLGQATLSGTVAWRHASGDTHTPMRQHFRDDIYRSGFDAHGLPIARHAWQLRLGVQADIGKRAQLGVHYSGQHGHRREDHGVQAGLTIRW